MPTGPFGFPRVTSLGPFTEREAQQEFTRNKKEMPYPMNDVWYTERDEGDIESERGEGLMLTKSRLIVREQPESDRRGIFGDIEEELQAVVGEKTVAYCDYEYEIGSNLGKIRKVEVDDPFRNMGIATELKQRAHQDMRENGIEYVYTDIVSDAGYRLAKRTGYEPSGMFHNKRGFMRRTL